jgi:FMN-dependent NADH-azoreductase
MPTLLSIQASPRGDYSISRTLSASFVEEWKKNHGGDVVTRDLFTSELPFIDVPWMGGAYTPAEQHSPEMAAAVKIGDQYIAELEAADTILIGTPMYNFNSPAILKAYIDHVVRINKTFSPSYEGLLKNKKAIVIIASGGVYTPGSFMESYNAESGYLKQILGFIGIVDVTFVFAGGSNDVAQGKKTQQDLVAQYQPEVIALAS